MADSQQSILFCLHYLKFVAAICDLFCSDRQKASSQLLRISIYNVICLSAVKINQTLLKTTVLFSCL